MWLPQSIHQGICAHPLCLGYVLCVCCTTHCMLVRLTHVHTLRFVCAEWVSLMYILCKWGQKDWEG